MHATPIAATAPQPQRRTFLRSEIKAAHTRVAELAKQHPSWPGCRVRAAVARELDVSTNQLRYLLSMPAE